MRLRTQIWTVVIGAQVKIRTHPRRGHKIKGNIVSITHIFSLIVYLFHFKLQWGTGLTLG